MSTDFDTSTIKRVNWQDLKAILPDFANELKLDTDLLAQLGLQTKTRNLIDYGPAALSRLEARAMKDFDVRKQLESTARANFDAQAQTHALCLSLMESRNLSDLARRLDHEIVTRFGLVSASLALEDTGRVPHGWMSLADGGVDYIVGETALSLLGPEGNCRAIFGDNVSHIKSAAVLRIALWRENRVGLIAFGSRDFEGFSPEMGAELIAFVARVVERVADRWPVLA